MFIESTPPQIRWPYKCHIFAVMKEINAQVSNQGNVTYVFYVSSGLHHFCDIFKALFHCVSFQYMLALQIVVC